jgi:hypothetical protein
MAADLPRLLRALERARGHGSGAIEATVAWRFAGATDDP